MEDRTNTDIGQHNELKAFKIKTLQNFNIAPGITASKVKPVSPSKGTKLRASPKKLSEVVEPVNKGAVDTVKLSLKQDNRPSGSAFNLEKYLKPVEKSPPTAKISLNVQSPGKKITSKNENNSNSTERAITLESASTNTVIKALSPKSTTKLLLLPPGATNELKREERTAPKTISKIFKKATLSLLWLLENNITNAVNTKEAASRNVNLTNIRNSLKKK